MTKIKLIVGDREVQFSNLSIKEELGRINSLSVTILKNRTIKCNEPIVVYSGDNAIFSGYIVNISKSTENSDLSITALEETWLLKSIPVSIKQYVNISLSDLFFGFSLDYLNPIDVTSRYFEAVCLSDDDTDKTVVLVGQVGFDKNILVSEKLKLSETSQKSNWSLETSTDTWQSIDAMFVVDDNNRVVKPNGKIVLRDSSKKIIATIDNQKYVVANKDNKGYFANGILYKTNLDVIFNIDKDLKINARFNVSGSNLLEILTNLCSESVYYYDEPFKANLNFKLKNNSIILKDIPKIPNVTLREKLEVSSATSVVDIQNLKNISICKTKDRIFLLRDFDSIKEWGPHIGFVETDLTGPEADNYIRKELDNSRVEPAITLSTNPGYFIEAGSLAYVDLPTIQTKGEFIVQSSNINIGLSGIGRSSVTLSNKPRQSTLIDLLKNSNFISVLKRERLSRW